MDSKPIITYAGDTALFQDLEAALVEAIPKESTEWQRPYGRLTKTVYMEAKFEPFQVDSLPKTDDLKLIHQPMLHMFWTECNDLESYKSGVKEEIEQWQKTLNSPEWMIVIVEVYDIRKSNKLLPRTTVLDKIRADFAAKQGDRVISLIHPIKSESKSAESWRGLVNRIRVLLLLSYSKALSKFEEAVRKNRECRPQPFWSFCNYFLMQEELALVLEMLGLYDEALVQYDELDALFTQFILNSTKGENPKWLNSFRVPLQQWAGPSLKQKVTQSQRDLIKCSKLDLLQFRSYLFGRQCSLLLLEKKPWETAQRCLAFLHNCINELHILEVTAPEGAIACWIFLVCLEVLQTCENYTGTPQVEAYSLYTAGLWSYARDKLKELGLLCGLTPGTKPTSEQLHIVVGLSSGMGDSTFSSSGPTPTDKLKEALSSKEAYNNYFLELSELSISTFKHIGRMRSARLVGADLANFYLALGQPDKAITFLTGALGGYQEEKWPSLAADIHLQLVQCCASNPTDVKYVTSCAAVASSDLDNNIKLTYFYKFLDSLTNIPQGRYFVFNLVGKAQCDSFTRIVDLAIALWEKLQRFIFGDFSPTKSGTFPSASKFEFILSNVVVNLHFLVPSDKTLTSNLEDIGDTISITLAEVNKLTEGESTIECLMEFSSRLPGPVDCKAVFISLEKEEAGKNEREGRRKGDKASKNVFKKLPLVELLNYKQDRSLNAANIVCEEPKKVLRRADSHGRGRKISMPMRNDFSICFSCENVTLQPGRNVLALGWKTQDVGRYQMGQISVMLGGLELLGPVPPTTPHFMVEREKSTVEVNQGDKELLAGLLQQIQLVVHAGSYAVKEGMALQVKCSEGLQATWNSESEAALSSDFEIPLPCIQPFDKAVINLRVLAKLPPQRDRDRVDINHKMVLKCQWCEEEIISNLKFHAPLKSVLRLHTALYRKFLQVTVTGLTPQRLIITSAQLIATNTEQPVIKSLNSSKGQSQIIENGLNLSLLWEVDISAFQDADDVIKLEFSMDYSPIGEEKDTPKEIRNYKCHFDLQNYKTLFIVTCNLEPGKEADFCRVGTMCQLNLEISRSQFKSFEDVSLMYEVSVDQTMWAVCGRAAGVITLEKCSKQNVALEVMPLSQGFLPLPCVRLSKYIPALDKDSTRQESSRPRLEPFSPGQVYSASKSRQVHVLPAPSVDG